jgi:asparagine synthase (glutamine-hydrolysing)
MRLNRKKAYFKDLIADVVPERVLKRPKSGFQVDSPHFVGVTLSALLDHWLSDELTEKHGLFNPDFVRQIRTRPWRGAARWHYFVIYLMMLSHVWIDVFENPAAGRG